MKQFAVLLVAVALVTPAFAQKPVSSEKALFQGTHPRPKLASVTPAHKPLLLHTGKSITAAEKTQFLASVVTAARAAQPPAKQKRSGSAPSSQAVTKLSPDQMYVNGVVDTIVEDGFVDMGCGLITIPPGNANISNLTFVVDVQPNTAYMLAIKVVAFFPNNPQFTISGSPSGAGNQTPPGAGAQTFQGTAGDNEFVYGFDAASAGQLPVLVYANDGWFFVSAELTSSPF